MRLIDSVMEAVDNSPGGTTTESLAQLIYGDLNQYSKEKRRALKTKIGEKCFTLWRQGYIMAVFGDKSGPRWYPFDTDIKEAVL